MELAIVGFVSLFVMLPIFWLAYLWAKSNEFYSAVDVVWAFSFGLLSVLYYFQSGNGGVRSILFCLMFLLWSLRLGTHLSVRLKQHFPKEDRRYEDLRARWSANLNRNFWLFFSFQGVSAVLLALPLMIVILSPTKSFGPIEALGFMIWAVGLIGEAVADRQLKTFLADPANKGEVCQKGLWNYSRHPNYFFEWLIWVGYFVYALPAQHGGLALISPVIMLILLTKVTGVPYAEASSLRSKGDKFKEYQKTTSVFVPLPKKK